MQYKGLITIILVIFGHSALLAQGTAWSLSNCVDRALRLNISLNQSLANNEINRTNYEQAKANRLPNLNLTDAQAVNFGRYHDPVSNQFTNRNISSNNLLINSDITLFNGQKYANLIKGDKLYYEAGNLDIEKMKNDLTLSVVAAYLQVMLDYEAVQIAQSQIDATIEHLNYTERYVKAGVLPENNLLQMRSQLATDRAAKVDAENQLRIARVILMQLIELPVTMDFDIEFTETDGLLPDVDVGPDDIYHVAEGFLPEIKGAALKTKAATAMLKVSKAGVWPKLTLSGSVGTNYSNANYLNSYKTTSYTDHIGYLEGDPTQLVDGPVSKTITSSSNYPFLRQMRDNFFGGISLNLSIPLYNNLLYKSEIRRSAVAVRVAALNEDLIKNQVRKNIEIAYAEQMAASKNYAATKEQLVAEERSFRNITVKFKAGAISTTDFFVEKSMYNKAKLGHLQAKYQFLYKTKILDFYQNGRITY